MTGPGRDDEAGGGHGDSIVAISLARSYEIVG